MENRIRYNELVFKAKERMKQHQSNDDKLIYGLIELTYMRRDSMTPEAKEILERCTREEPTNNEGAITATVNKMSHQEVEEYIQKIKRL